MTMPMSKDAIVDLLEKDETYREVVAKAILGHTEELITAWDRGYEAAKEGAFLEETAFHVGIAFEPRPRNPYIPYSS